MNRHLLHPREPSQAICGIPAAQPLRRETENKRQRLLQLPSHELTLQRVHIYTHLTTRRDEP